MLIHVALKPHESFGECSCDVTKEQKINIIFTYKISYPFSNTDRPLLVFFRNTKFLSVLFRVANNSFAPPPISPPSPPKKNITELCFVISSSSSSSSLLSLALPAATCSLPWVSVAGGGTAAVWYPNVVLRPKRYVCPFCDKCFTNRQSRSRHVHQKHAAGLAGTCSICGHVYTNLQTRCVHTRVHSRKLLDWLHTASSSSTFWYNLVITIKFFSARTSTMRSLYAFCERHRWTSVVKSSVLVACKLQTRDRLLVLLNIVEEVV